MTSLHMDYSWSFSEVGFMIDSAPMNSNPTENQPNSFYETCLRQMRDGSLQLEEIPQGIAKLEEYKKHINKKINELGQANNPTQYLWKILLENISNPHLPPSVIAMLMVKTDQNNRQIRDFFRNQRKRSFIPIEAKLNAEIDAIVPKISKPDPILMSKVNAWCAPAEKPKDEIDLVLAFPKSV